jgi:hypothetical protein
MSAFFNAVLTWYQYGPGIGITIGSGLVLMAWNLGKSPKVVP